MRNIQKNGLAILFVALLLLAACAPAVIPPEENPPDSEPPLEEPIEELITVERIENYNLLSKEDINYTVIPRIDGTEYSWIYEPEKEAGEPKFVHGVAIAKYKDALVATWALNMVKENVAGEQCIGKWSYDGGKTWADAFEIKAVTPGYWPSHGSLFVADDGKLYCLLPVIKFKEDMTNWTTWETKMELHVYNDASGDWKYVSTPADDIWPLSAPIKMDDGNWIVAGLGKGRGRVAISNGEDISAPWQVVPMDIPSGSSFSEPAIIVNHNQVVVIMRNDNVTSPDTIGKLESRYYLAYAVSYDYGKTFEKAALSNLYGSPSKPFAGVLEDGRPYILFNQSMEYNNARRRLILGVGDAEEASINRFYLIDAKIGALSYPFAIEEDGKLYITYSSSIFDSVSGNKNNAKIAIIPIEEIK